VTKIALVPILASLAAIAVTSALDATGLTLFSALALFPLLILCCLIWRNSRISLGLVWGKGRDYTLAIVYPVAIVGACALIALASGAATFEHTHWHKTAINFGLLLVQGILVGLITEEGFFRGWLWASLDKIGFHRLSILAFTSVSFGLWHVSLVTLAKGFILPPSQAVLYIVNVAVIGSIWGQMRSLSGSIIVTSVSHALWNAGTYVLFGTGTFAGALGIAHSQIFDAEVGIVGLCLNVLFSGLLWWFQLRHTESSVPT
jgi:membrane protease YdiL (CAAX protease family)